MQRQRRNTGLLQIGIALAVLGILIQIILRLGLLLYPLANIAIIVGIVLVVLGLTLPRTRKG